MTSPTGRPRGRPPGPGGTKLRVTIGLPPGVLSAVDAAAERAGVSRSELIRLACVDYFAAEQAKTADVWIRT